MRKQIKMPLNECALKLIKEVEVTNILSGHSVNGLGSQKFTEPAFPYTNRC